MQNTVPVMKAGRLVGWLADSLSIYHPFWKFARFTWLNNANPILCVCRRRLVLLYIPTIHLLTCPPAHFCTTYEIISNHIKAYLTTLKNTIQVYLTIKGRPDYKFTKSRKWNYPKKKKQKTEDVLKNLWIIIIEQVIYTK